MDVVTMAMYMIHPRDVKPITTDETVRSTPHRYCERAEPRSASEPWMVRGANCMTK